MRICKCESSREAQCVPDVADLVGEIGPVVVRGQEQPFHARRRNLETEADVVGNLRVQIRVASQCDNGEYRGERSAVGCRVQRIKNPKERRRMRRIEKVGRAEQCLQRRRLKCFAPGSADLQILHRIPHQADFRHEVAESACPVGVYGTVERTVDLVLVIAPVQVQVELMNAGSPLGNRNGELGEPSRVVRFRNDIRRVRSPEREGIETEVLEIQRVGTHFAAHGKAQFTRWQFEQTAVGVQGNNIL